MRIEDDDLTINEDEVRFVLDKYSIPFPRFSLHWLGCFMIRNRLSWRKAYYLRRGSIDETYVDLYLQELAQAIIKFGYDRVFNMDENAVRVNNGSVLTFQRACFSKVSNLISENLS